MKVSPHEIPFDINRPPPGFERSPGLHVSDLYNLWFEEREPGRYKSDSGPNVEKIAIGARFEEVLERHMAQHYLGERPPEHTTVHAADCVDKMDGVCSCGAGIAFSPDYILHHDRSMLGEFKCTWQSSRQYEDTALPPKADKWVVQMQAYCWHLGIQRATLFIFFMNGNYVHPYTPELRAWDVHFSAEELKENWEELVNVGRRHGLIPDAAERL